MAKRLNEIIPKSIILDQYSNPANPNAHYYGTAEEIIAACGGEQLDMVVIGAGTGGTISGTARRLKEFYPNVKIVGVDPLGSLLADPEYGPFSPHFNQPYMVEGIGYDFVPKVMKHEFVDDWIVSTDAPSFKTARKLIATEGLLCGGSSGSAMWAALEAIRKHGMNEPGKKVLVLLPDSVRNYMSKFLSSDWMFANGFMSCEEYKVIKEIKLEEEKTNNLTKAITLMITFKFDDSIEHVLKELKLASSTSMFPVLNDSGVIVGNLDSSKLLEKALSTDRAELLLMPLKRFMNKEFLTTQLMKEGALLKCAAKVPVYLVNEQGKAVLDSTGHCQVINPFRLLD